jgi:FkbM family methyltransferase
MKGSGHAGGAVMQVQAIFGPLLAYEDDLITNQILKFGAHTRPELAMLLSVIASGDHVFDLGAHIGTFTIPIAKKVGTEGRVLAVEAFPRTHRILCKNLRMNGQQTIVETVNALIAPADNAYAAVRKARNTGGTRFEAAKTGLPLPCTTIDELSAAHFRPRVIKIDIEGFEAFALTNSAVVRHEKPVLYSEVSAASLGRNGSSIGELNSFASELGYLFFRNAGPRNADNDTFTVEKLQSLQDGGDFFDVLAIHEDDERHSWLAAGKQPLDQNTGV